MKRPYRHLKHLRNSKTSCKGAPVGWVCILRGDFKHDDHAAVEIPGRYWAFRRWLAATERWRSWR